jgi:hypothetical protein
MPKTDPSAETGEHWDTCAACLVFALFSDVEFTDLDSAKAEVRRKLANPDATLKEMSASFFPGVRQEAIELAALDPAARSNVFALGQDLLARGEALVAAINPAH